MEKRILLRMFSWLIRGYSLEKTLYRLYLETGDEHMYNLLMNKMKSGKADLPYIQEAEVLSTIEEDRDRLVRYLRKIIDVEYIKGELTGLKRIFSKRITILLLILYITIPVITAFTPLLSMLNISVVNTSSMNAGDRVNMPDTSIYILHALASMTLSTIYLNRIGRFSLAKMILIQLLLFISIYQLSLSYLWQLIPWLE